MHQPKASREVYRQSEISGAPDVAAASRESRLLAPTRAEIDLGALRHNVRTLQRQTGDASILAVVKANAYGHGAVPIARELQRLGLRRFAVATLTEAMELREAGIEDPILVFGAALPQNLPLYAAHRLGATVASDLVVDEIIRLARDGHPLEAHLKVDTGMGRIGINPSDAGPAAKRLLAAPGVDLVSAWTHFATADEADSTFVEQQLERWRTTIRPLRDDIPFTHVANSGALLNHSELLDLDSRTWARPGITIYGLSPSPEVDLAAVAGLRPVMRVVSVVTHVKQIAAGSTVSYSRRWTAESDRMIATVAAGYADGYPRILTNRGVIGIGGQPFPVAGTVCMDMTMVDLGPPDAAPDVSVGSEAVLFGSGGPSCFDIAHAAGTITYEIACRVSRRVPRQYLNASDPE